MFKVDTWLWYVLLAGLSWGTYVPLIFYGGSELGGKPASRLMAILCVGIAYFVIAVLIPVGLYATGRQPLPEMTRTGLVFSGLAGVAGAVGALCVVFATQSAMASARDAGLPPSTYKVYIAPLIFALAPVINVLASLVWHPQKGEPFHFGLKDLPGWKLWAGMVLVGVGAFLVLLSKEEAEAALKPAAGQAAEFKNV
jgi:drug/metabolite transporter (DMT)-like permease